MARKRKPGKGGADGPAMGKEGPKTKAKNSTTSAGKAQDSGGLGAWVRSLVGALVIFLFIRVLLIETYFIDSGSMEGTLLVGDFLVVNKLAIGPGIPFTDIRLPGYSKPRRGDILVFDPHHEEDMIIVKRLIGMPGDTLEMRDKVLYLNGEPFEEPYVVTLGARDQTEPQMGWQDEFVVGGASDDYRPTWGQLGAPGDPRGPLLHARRQP